MSSRALLTGGVDFVIVGGLAVAAHGFVRGTKDMDIVPDPERANLSRLAKVLRELEAVYHETGDFDPREFPFDPFNADDLVQGGNSSWPRASVAWTSCSGSLASPATSRSSTSQPPRRRLKCSA